MSREAPLKRSGQGCLLAYVSQEPDRRFDALVEVGQIETLVGRVEVIVGQAETQQHRIEAQFGLERCHDGDRAAFALQGCSVLTADWRFVAACGSL